MFLTQPPRSDIAFGLAKFAHGAMTQVGPFRHVPATPRGSNIASRMITYLRPHPMLSWRNVILASDRLLLTDEQAGMTKITERESKADGRTHIIMVKIE